MEWLLSNPVTWVVRPAIKDREKLWRYPEAMIVKGIKLLLGFSGFRNPQCAGRLFFAIRTGIPSWQLALMKRPDGVVNKVFNITHAPLWKVSRSSALMRSTVPPAFSIRPDSGICTVRRIKCYLC